MPVLTQSVTSTEYIWQQVLTSLVTGAAYSPVNDPVYLAFVPAPAPPGVASSPSPGQLNPAIWATGPGPTYFAGVLVGPANGGLVLAVGSYQIWVKVTDNPEVPVKPGWILQIDP